MTVRKNKIQWIEQHEEGPKAEKMKEETNEVEQHVCHVSILKREGCSVLGDK